MSEGLLVGKLVQAAVAGGATQIRFSLGASEMLVKLYFPDLPASLQQVQRHLACATTLALQSQPRRLEWQCQSQRLDLRQGVSESQQLVTQGLATFTLERGWNLWSELKAWLFARGNAHSHLYQRACLSPVPVFLDAARINSGNALDRWGPHDALRLAPQEASLQDRLLGPVPRLRGPVPQRAGRAEVDGRSLFCELHPTGQTLPTFFLFGAGEARLAHIQLAPGATDIPQLTHPQALALCHAGVIQMVGDHSVFHLQEQWEWLNPGRHLSVATTIKGEPSSLLVKRWLQFAPESPRVSELWPVQDGLILEPVPLTDAPPGCRVVSLIPSLQLEADSMTVVKNDAWKQLQDQLGVEIRQLYQALKTD